MVYCLYSHWTLPFWSSWAIQPSSQPRYVKWLRASKNPIFHQHAPPEPDEVPEPEPPSPGPQGGLKMTGARFMAGFYGTTSHGGLILIVMFWFILICFGEPRLWIGVVSQNWIGYQCHNVTPEMIIASSQQLCLGWPRSWYAQVPAANDLQQESGTTQVAPRISKILEHRFLYFFVGSCWVHS